VNEVTEAEVFESANGGVGYRTAYWVVYINGEQKLKASLYDIYD